jgi:3-oxoacyl-[acyl-carrier-protein] synthase II
MADRDAQDETQRAARAAQGAQPGFGHPGWGGPPPLTPRRVVITGIGAVTSLGGTADETWRRVAAGETGIRRVDGLEPGTHGCTVRGDVADEDISDRFLVALGPKVARNTSRFSRMALEAAGEALLGAGLIDEDGNPLPGADLADGGTSIGTCLGGTHDDLIPAYDVFRDRGPNRVPAHLHVMFPHNLASYAIQSRFGLYGPSSTVVTACATGSQAIGDAFHAVKFGRASLMIAGATESDEHPFFLAGFTAMRALVTDSNDDPGAASRPFDSSRAGFVLGEGAGMLVLEERERALARGARIYAEILGYGTSNDAYHPIAPQPEGLGAARAIRAALADGGVAPEQVDHVQAHAASTPAGDLAEARAIYTVFGERAAQIPVTSIKGAVGHCMGAAGAIETVVAVRTLAEQCIPPTRNYRTPDPEIGLDIVHGSARPADLDIITKHSFGLGGQNACLVLGRADL